MLEVSLVEKGWPLFMARVVCLEKLVGLTLKMTLPLTACAFAARQGGLPSAGSSVIPRRRQLLKFRLTAKPIELNFRKRLLSAPELGNVLVTSAPETGTPALSRDRPLHWPVTFPRLRLLNDASGLRAGNGKVPPSLRADWITGLEGGAVTCRAAQSGRPGPATSTPAPFPHWSPLPSSLVLRTWLESESRAEAERRKARQRSVSVSAPGSCGGKARDATPLLEAVEDADRIWTAG